MSNPLIKICGIKDVIIAAAAVKAGANYIGIVFHPASPRHVEVQTAIKIAKVVQMLGARPIAVFVNQSAIEMHAICEATNIKSVQLHGEKTRQDHHFLPGDYQRFYVVTAEQNDSIDLTYLDKDRDYLLVDQIKSHQSSPIDWKNFHYTYPLPWFLAGGLSSSNVQTALSILQPNGLDVSSSVETSRGNKNENLIQQFILTARTHDTS